jgi:hypothetical protein
MEIRLSALIILLAVPAHAAGLAAPSIYRDPAVILPQNLATDLVTLVVGLPLLGGAALAMRTGSLRARVLWLAALGFLVYDYAMYALAVRWNRLFLVYVALLGLALFALIVGLAGTDPGPVRTALAGRAPVRSAVAYLVGVVVAVGATWLAEELRAAWTGTLPPTVQQFGTPTNMVHVLDLGIVFPAMGLAAVLLVRDRPWGYVLTSVLLVKAATIGLWVLAMIWFSARAGIGSPPAYIALFALLTVAGGALAWRFVSRLALADG